LIIVESPTKVHTIQKFLGPGYDVIASQGHVRDLPKSKLGVHVESDFEPDYITIRGKGDIVNALKKATKKADKIYLATDPDREGEAISWHLQEILNLKEDSAFRVTFNEITKDAVKTALKKPRKINMDLVNAQQARRILDRVVGYELSPILWKKVKGKLSAGRVQSAVLRMVSDRENEIHAFVPEEYWSFSVELDKENHFAVSAEYFGKGARKGTLSSEKSVKELEKLLQGKSFVTKEIQDAQRTKNPPYPFTTSTLQQEASAKLNFSTQKTMRLAQTLYEGVKVKGQGTIGLITYLRTDSTRIADEADKACKGYIADKYGEGHVGKGNVKNNTSAQDAHEAIRPANVFLTPDMVKEDLGRDEFRLYQLIWKRFVASRMKPAVYDTRTAKFDCEGYTFTSSSSKLSFPGYTLVSGNDEEKTTGDADLLKLSEGDSLSLTKAAYEQHFTKPVAHFTEATLVRAMEEAGLGRPSTYAPTITNILGRHYITKEGKSLYMTELGEAVNELMVKSFPDVVDIGFTAQMEESLDEVAEGQKDWHQLLKNFYPNFEKEVQVAEEELEHVKIEDELSDEVCDLCGRRMVIKYGPHGKFLACPGFPECKNTKPYLEKADVKCPNCGKDILILRSKKGRKFFACEDQNCGYMSWTKPKK